MPRFTTPQQILGRTAPWFTSGSQRHFSLPVRASTAKTTLQLVIPKMVPFQNRGVASWPPPPGPILSDHANPSRPTLLVLICLSGLNRVSPCVRPYVSHSSPFFAAFFRAPSSTRRTCWPATMQTTRINPINVVNAVFRRSICSLFREVAVFERPRIPEKSMVFLLLTFSFTHPSTESKDR